MAMRTVSFYDVATGLFSGSTFSSDEMTAANLKRHMPDGHGAVEGKFDHLSQKVDMTQIAELRAAHESAHAAHVQSLRATFHPEMPGSTFKEPALPLFAAPATVVIDHRPPAPDADHVWNAATKRWALSEVATARNAARASALARISQLEGAQHRSVRELARDPSNAEARKRIDVIEAEISKLREVL